ncbi:MAG: hypothetical protein OEQ74_05820, partial [Gammaproteobacteria bacterium]|nr:hypothetical protein [Gammaproteobacteria bacterium]
AVTEAEAAIARAREVAAESDSSGGGNQDSFDPWLEPGAGENAANTDSAGGGGQPEKTDGEGDDSAAAGSGEDSASGPEEVAKTRGGRSAGDDSFDPFADYGEQAGAPGQPTGAPKAGSLQIADDAVAAARAALNRARRALITAADAGEPGTGDADAEAVQLAAARAAMEAAAEAVIASAIAVMAASDAHADDADQGDDREQQAGEEALAEGIAKVVSVVQRDMRNAADALDATGELLAAAGTLMGMLSMGDEQQEENDGSGTDPGDRVANLEEELDKSLAVFDDRMHAEGSSIVTGMAGEDSEITGAAQSGDNVDPRLSRETSNESGKGDERGGRPNLATGRPRDAEWNAPRDPREEHVPTRDSETQNEEFVIDDSVRAQDDDIVARQLREAAMAEQDPELREALWQEYKIYKESLETGEAEAN